MDEAVNLAAAAVAKAAVPLDGQAFDRLRELLASAPGRDCGTIRLDRELAGRLDALRAALAAAPDAETVAAAVVEALDEQAFARLGRLLGSGFGGTDSARVYDGHLSARLDALRWAVEDLVDPPAPDHGVEAVVRDAAAFAEGYDAYLNREWHTVPKRPYPRATDAGVSWDIGVCRAYGDRNAGIARTAEEALEAEHPYAVPRSPPRP